MVQTAISNGVTKPNIATSTTSKFDEIHNGKYRLKPKNLDKEKSCNGEHAIYTVMISNM